MTKVWYKKQSELESVKYMHQGSRNQIYNSHENPQYGRVPDNCSEQSGSCFIVKSDDDASVRQVFIVLHRTTPAIREGLIKVSRDRLDTFLWAFDNRLKYTTMRFAKEKWEIFLAAYTIQCKIYSCNCHLVMSMYTSLCFDLTTLPIRSAYKYMYMQRRAESKNKPSIGSFRACQSL